jgi:hypothetical protein
MLYRVLYFQYGSDYIYIVSISFKYEEINSFMSAYHPVLASIVYNTGLMICISPALPSKGSPSVIYYNNETNALKVSIWIQFKLRLFPISLVH